MFKKILSLVLAVMMLMSVAVVMASAAEGDVAEAGADGEVADTGLDTTTCLNFDNSVTNWVGPIKFYVYPIGGSEIIAWGSKKLDGTDNGDGTWSYDPSAMGLVDGQQYCIIFNDGTSGAQTYNLLFDTSCIGDTAYVTGTALENPEDSNKTAIEAKWKGHDNFGPELKITSIGNVVGTTCASSTTPYQMLVDFLKNTLDNARTYSNKDDQTLLDDTAKALGLTKDDVTKAISEAGATVSWDASKSSLSGGSSNTTSSTTGTTSSTSSKTSSTSSTTKTTGSASNTQTGQGETVLFIMLGVMVAAAGVIFFARKKERA